MKPTIRFTTNSILLCVLIAAQIAFFFLPNTLTVPFLRLCRPVIYSYVLITFFFVNGTDKRPLPKAGESIIIAAIGVVLYFIAAFVLSVLFGYTRNGMVSGLSAFFDNIWIYATVAFMSELLRVKIIKNSLAVNQYITASTITIVYTFLQIETLRDVSFSSFTSILYFFYTVIFPAFMLNSVLSYMALDGSFLAVILIRFTYSLSPVLMPVLPNVNRVLWTAVSSALLFVTAVLYHSNMSDKSKKTQQIARRRAKYQKKPVLAFFFTAFVIALLIAFNLRAFPYFPVVVLTGSMTGALDRGSIVFVEKLSPENVFIGINEGDIIHFRIRKFEMMHRVIGFRYNESGERVYITKGDANQAADSTPVEITQVIGVSRLSLPYIGYPVIILHEIFGG